MLYTHESFLGFYISKNKNSFFAFNIFQLVLNIRENVC